MDEKYECTFSRRMLTPFGFERCVYESTLGVCKIKVYEKPYPEDAYCIQSKPTENGGK
jgi:hypothetical protein